MSIERKAERLGRNLGRSVGVSAGVLAAIVAAVLLAQRVWPTDSPSSPVAQTLVEDTRATMADTGLDAAEALVARYREDRGVTSEYLAAVSWLGRGALAAEDLDRANRHAVDAYKLTLAAIEETGDHDLTDANLETALGASIEVQAQVGAARGNRSEAVYFLTQELAEYAGTPVHKRIQKNLNLLSLAGQPAPALDASEHLERPVPSFDDLEGQVVLMFFWAHWCSDCKAEGPIVARMLEKYGDQGLTLVAPTQRYGYTAATDSPSPGEERAHIIAIRDQYYPFLREAPVPMSVVNHQRYGVSTTPTMVLVDREGQVRLYHPGSMTEAELDTEIRALL